MSFLNSRLKAIEKKLGTKASEGYLIVFVSTEDGSSIEVSATLQDGTQKKGTVHTEEALHQFFNGSTSKTVCFVDFIDYFEPVKGSLYESVLKYGVTTDGRIDIN